MKKPVTIECHWCGKLKDVPAKEYKRQTKKGRTNFFCSLSCSAHYVNSLRPGVTSQKNIEKVCPTCGDLFKTRTGADEKTYCSIKCSPLKGISLSGVAKGIRNREMWRYEKLHKLLKILDISHEFEHPVGEKCIFDLALINNKMLVEFDEPKHSGIAKEKDKIRDQYAKSLGWDVIRLKVKPNNEIPPKLLLEILRAIL